MSVSVFASVFAFACGCGCVKACVCVRSSPVETQAPSCVQVRWCSVYVARDHSCVRVLRVSVSVSERVSARVAEGE